MKIISMIGLGLILFANALFLSGTAFESFSFFDFGSFLDASWRVYRGQIPFNDFIYTTGPIHLYLNALFFWIFGFGKLAILAHLLTASSIVIVSIYFFIKKFTNIFIAIFIAAFSAVSFYWQMTHPWYDQSSHFFGVLAFILAFDQLMVTNKTQVSWKDFLIGSLCALSFQTKSNIGVAYTVVFFIFFIFLKDYKRLFLYGLSWIGVNVLIFSLSGISFSSYIDQAFSNYGLAQHSYSQSKRTAFLLAPISWFRNYYWLIISCVLCAVSKYFYKLLPQLVLFFGVVFTGLFAMLTGSMLFEINVPLQALCCGIAFIILFKAMKTFEECIHSRAFRISFLSLIVLTFFLMTQSVVYAFNLRLAQSKDNIIGDYQIKSEPFTGWLCYHENGKDLDDMIDFIRNKIPKSESLLVLTDMQILYALTERDSYKGIPFIFHDGHMPAPGKQLKFVRNNIIQSSPDWIVIHKNHSTFVSFLPHYLGLRDFILSNYKVEKSFINYNLLKKH